jgi:tetratricopeptide (TPR) repeat protein
VYDDERTNAALASFVEGAVAQALALQEADSFLQWARDRAPLLFPDLFSLMPDEKAARQLATALGRGIWNALPLPRNGFRPAPLPNPERNAPCPCGSGTKYKRCCATTPALSEFSPEGLLPLVLDLLPESELARVVEEGRAPLPVVEELARRLIGDGRAALAVQLLEPLLDEPHLDARHEGVLDALFDAYLETGQQEHRRGVLEKLLARVRPPLSAAVRLRQAQIFHDAGERDAAWVAWERARRDDPDRAELGPLEVMFLMVEGRLAEASTRAGYWIAHLRRLGYQGDEQPIPFLEEVREGPEKALTRWSEEAHLVEDEVLVRLAELATAASRRPPSQYAVATLGEQQEIAVLATPPDLEAIEQQWTTIWKLGKPFSIQMELDSAEQEFEVWDDADRWLEFLEHSPAAFDSLEILDDLCLAVDACADAPLEESAVLMTLAARGEQILRQALPGGARQLAWTALENRSGLRLAVRRVHLLLDDEQTEPAIELMDWLIAVNPEDNHGLRCILADEYLRAGRHLEMAALGQRYPDDVFADVRYGHVLALYRLDRKGEALVALHGAISALPLVYDYLVSARPKQPPTSRHGIALGGKEEAWLYRANSGDLWRDDAGVLGWLTDNGEPLRRRAKVRRAS